MRKAFTLAEILITLGIIGIVAAMTIPALNASIREKQSKTRLKATYTILQQALKLAEANDDAYGAWDYEHNPEFTQKTFKTLSKYLKVSQDCGTAAGCWNQKKGKNGENAIWATENGLFDESYCFTLINGSSICMDVWREGNIANIAGVTRNLINNDASLVFSTDTNGNLPPNTLGKDVFMFVLTQDGLVPSGIDNNGANCDNEQTNTNWDCTYKFLKK